ncbi:Carnitine O-acetyltransferase mitochondrial [Rhodotorula mucilaginosa]|uniref:Carnitine O-acetyltransferase mitochondrial n=1 Tax=Rhodotorula mucilaginosa TaxID=5537 RepID=A0A9P7B2V6_RHOMI|nr:Carnitine O-acetyltransferase mitochondrial [Rhodotorula mucilaginosa]
MPPVQTPDWHDWRMRVPTVIPTDSVMFRNQHKLPKLPLPKLDDTLSRLVRSCEALAERPEAAQQVRRKAEAFERGPGSKLQTLLDKKRGQPEMRNWLARDWDEQAYMAYRDSVVINVSYYFGFKRLPQSAQASRNAKPDPAYVAASIASTALEFRQLVTQGLLEPELVGRSPEDGELCMESYKWAFNACRVPASPSDYAVKTREDDPAAQCFVVVKQNRFYRIPFADEQGRHYSTEALRQALQTVIDGNASSAAPPVGILTGVNRDHWAEAYGHLAANPANVPSIRTIQQSAFVICLDEAEPTEIVDFSRKLWTGEKEAGNRWWDKPLQWVVYRNGESGFIGEHSCMDGTPTARLNDYLSKRLLSGESPVRSDNEISHVPTVKDLPFELDSTSKQQIQAAETEFAEHIKPYDVHYTLYTRYGKEGIKKMKTSPDGWVQMLFQMAYYLTFHRFCGTYEAAQTRRYQLGRTETVRILTPEVVAFVKAVVDESASTNDKLSLFRAAIAQHGKDMKLASAGMGIDRHLFGLKMLAAAPDGQEFSDAERKEVMKGDGLFADPLVKASGTWKMSTSQIYIENAPSYGWGPVAEGGLGIPYMIHPHTLQLTVTCTNDVPGAEFVRNFEKAADMLMDLHEAEAGKKSARL